MKKESIFVIIRQPKGKLHSRNKDDLIRVFSALIRGNFFLTHDGINA